jgi:hypothetical protein
MKLSAKTGVALTITTLSLVVTVGAGASEPAYHVEEDPLVHLRQVPADAAHVVTVGAAEPAYHVEEDPLVYLRQVPADAAYVGMMNQLRNLTEPNAIKWGWSQGLANDQASTGMTQ